MWEGLLMKRAHVLRGIAIAAVLVMASMTAGCLKTEIAMSISPGELVCVRDAKFDGTITVEMKGFLAGGKYDTLTVKFFEGGNDEPLATMRVDDLMIVVSPLGKIVKQELAELDGLVAPAVLWDDEGVFRGAKAQFTLTSTGLGVQLNPLVCEVGLVEAR
jgi:hypothetical protein